MNLKLVAKCRRLLSLVISLAILGGGTTFSPGVRAQSSSCTNGLDYNSILGRCLTTEQASRLTQAAQQCESQSTDVAKKQCYTAAAEGRLKDAEASGEISGAGKVKTEALSTMLVLAGLGSSILFLATNKGCPGATSAYMIAGGSAAALAGEVLAQSQYKKKLKQAQESLTKIQSADGGGSSGASGTDLQAEAFDALIAQEDAVISAAKTKKKLYTLATAAYAGAAVLAGVEIIRGKTNPTDVNCMSKEEQQRHREANRPSEEELDRQADEAAAEYDRKYAADPEFAAAEDARNAREAALPLEQKTPIVVTATRLGSNGGFRRLYSKPETRLALSAALTANNVFMLKKISKEEQKAKERKIFLEKLRDQVTAAGTAFSCTSADRTNPGNLNCYCYGTDGKANPARSNSQVCAALFQKNGLASGDYATGSGEPIPNFCTSSKGLLDETCSCKATNSCLVLNGLGGNLGATGINLGAIPATLNSVNGGTLNGANLDEGALTAQAARLAGMVEAIKKKKPEVAAAAKRGSLAASTLLKASSGRIAASSANSPSLSSGGFGEALLPSATPEEVLAKIKSEISTYEAAPTSTLSSADEGLNFSGLGGTPTGGVVIDEGQLAAAVEGAMANGNSDISTSDGNIFQILTNRYQRSGLRRLFGDQGLPVEQANESDISK